MKIILGEENRRTLIKQGINGEELVSNDTFQVLDCDEYRSFWLTWDNQIYQVCLCLLHHDVITAFVLLKIIS